MQVPGQRPEFQVLVIPGHALADKLLGLLVGIDGLHILRQAVDLEALVDHVHSRHQRILTCPDRKTLEYPKIN